MKNTTLLQQIATRTKYFITVACFSLVSLSANSYDISINGSENLKMDAILDGAGTPTVRLLDYDYDASPSTISFHVTDPLVCTSKSDSASPNIIASIQDSNGIEITTQQNNITATVYDLDADKIDITTDDTMLCATTLDAANNVAVPPNPDVIFKDSFEDTAVVANNDIQLALLKVTDSAANPMVTEPFPSTPIFVALDQVVEYQYVITNNGQSSRTIDFVEYYGLIADLGPIFADALVTDDWVCSLSATSSGPTNCGTTTSDDATVRLDNAVIAPGDSLIVFATRKAFVDASDIANNKTIDMLASVFIVDAGAPDDFPANNTTYQEFGSTLISATQIVMTTQPSNAVSGATIGSIEIQFQDAAGFVDTGNSSSVTITIQNNPSTGVLGGTVTKSALNGIATFTDLNIDKVGVGYTLVATSGSFISAVSNSMNISAGAASQLVVTTQPLDTVAGGIINTVIVELQDVNGNLVTSSASLVQANITPFTGGGGSLSGTNTATVISGLATFNTLSIDSTGINYQLRFTSNLGSVTTTDSGQFDVTAVPVAANSEYGVSANSTTVGTLVTYSALIKDVSNNPVGAGIVVNFAMINTTANTSPVSCITGISGDCSVVTTSTLVGTTMVAADIGGINVPNVTSGLFSITTWVAGAPDGSMSNFWIDTATASTGSSTVNVMAEVKDQYGNFVTGVPVTFSLDDTLGATTPNFPSCSSPTNSVGLCSVSVTSATTGTTTIASAAAGFPSVIITNPTPPMGFGRVITWQ